MNIAIILASGIGSRFSKDEIKQFVEINNVPLLVLSIRAFEENDNINKILVVTNDVEKVKGYILKYGFKKIINVISGGQSRQESVFKGLQELKKLAINDDDIILIHDGARPLVSQKIINENVIETKKYGDVTTALKITSTISKAENNKLLQIVPRDDLYEIQTPQSFKFIDILSAHDFALKNKINKASDDAQLVKLIGKDVYIVNGERQNIKLTTKEDLLLIESLLAKK